MDLKIILYICLIGAVKVLFGELGIPFHITLIAIVLLIYYYFKSKKQQQ